MDDESERSGRDRLRAALTSPRPRGQAIVAVLLAVLGFAAVVQVRSTTDTGSFAGARQEDLIQLLDSLSAAAQRAEGELADLEQTRNSLRSSSDSRQAALEQARQQADVLGILAGTLPAVGPGVVITVEDPVGAVGADQLLNGLEELRDAGAEAIEINDAIRVVASSYLTDDPEGTRVDGQQVLPPYRIEAIGDPHTLSQAMQFVGGFADTVSEVGGRLRIEQRENVEIATVRQLVQPQYAEPVPGE